MKIHNGSGLFAATVGLSAVVTAGFGWMEVIIGWSIAALLRQTLPKTRKSINSRFCAVTILLGCTIILSAAVMAAEKAFPEDGTFPFVSLGLMLLLYRTITGKRETGKIVSNVLGLILLGLLGAILVFGLADISWKETLPTEFAWKQVLIIISIAAPWWCTDERPSGWGWFFGSAAMGVGISVMVRGVLGAALTQYSDLPLYQAVQTIEILGTLQRFEALLAAAVLLGTYAEMAFVGEIIAEAAARIWPEQDKRKWVAVFLLIAFFIEHGYRSLGSSVQNELSTAFWGMTPIFTLWVVICRKIRKNEKSS